jgi:hypothetical protein
VIITFFSFGVKNYLFLVSVLFSYFFFSELLLKSSKCLDFATRYFISVVYCPSFLLSGLQEVFFWASCL